MYYKITKIVRALRLAERRVCKSVYKHGFDVKYRENDFEKVLSWKLHKFTLFTHSLGGWNFENLYKYAVPIFFRLSWHLEREKSVFWKASFLQINKIWRARLRVQDFATGENFSFN